MDLPQAFRERMERLLGEEYGAFLESFDGEREQGLRLNLLKTDPERFKREAPFHLKPIPWAAEGYYYSREDRPGRHPLHDAGVYYIQEPSAMAVVELLDPKPGERVLDLCAAPGGKTSHIASRLLEKGFLLSNEIHPARARILSQNVERMGIGNAAVTNETPERLAGYFPEFFDRIAVDAPCSGEGMFRKDEGARSEWSPENVALCAARQAEILENAARMLKPGGIMAYSTCTFSPEEDEQAVEAFLKAHPDFRIKQVKKYPGLSDGVPEWSLNKARELSDTIRIWPHRAAGEGHFIAILERNGPVPEAEGRQGEGGERKKERPLRETGRGRGAKSPACLKDKNILKDCRKFFEDSIKSRRWGDGEWERLYLFGEQLYLLSPELPAFDGLRVLRPGLHLGTLKKNRFEPSHALALWLREEEAARFCRLGLESGELSSYLRGGTVSLEQAKAHGATVGGIGSGQDKGWVLVTEGEGEWDSGYPAGWAKLSGGTLKNHYPKGLRIQG